MRRALLFDLDDTLVVEEPAARASFVATAALAGSRHDGIDEVALADGARSRARELWYAGSDHDYCRRIGISSWEGLWCRFEGDRPELRSLREWSPAYRRETWTLALTDQGVDDPLLAAELAERFGRERRARHEVFPDAVGALAALRESHVLALVTNGAACLQREKLAASGLNDYFDVVVVSADLDVAKPDASVFQHVLSLLEVNADRAVMVGDSIRKDVDGALAAGLGAIWLNREGGGPPADRADLVEISTLGELPNAIGRAAPPPTD